MVSFWWYEIWVRQISTDLVNYLPFEFIGIIQLKNNGTPLESYQKWSEDASCTIMLKKCRAVLRICLENFWGIAW